MIKLKPLMAASNRPKHTAKQGNVPVADNGARRGADVFVALNKRAVEFTPRASSSSEDTRGVLGRQFLGVLREGLRLKDSSVVNYDLEKTLLNYYPLSMRVARALAADSEMASGVKAFVDQPSVFTDDLRPLAREAVGIAQVRVIEANPKPLATSSSEAALEHVVQAGRNAPLPPVLDHRAEPSNFDYDFDIPTGPISTSSPDTTSTWLTKYESILEILPTGLTATDEQLMALNDSTQGTIGWNMTDWVGRCARDYALDQLIEFQARRAELAKDHPHREAFFAAAREGISKLESHEVNEKTVRPLVRYANALGIPANEVTFGRPWAKFTLAYSAKEYGLPGRPRSTLRSRSGVEMLGSFAQTATGSAPGLRQAQVESLERLRSTAADSLSFKEIVETATELLKIEDLTRLKWSELDEAQRTSVLKALTVDSHVGSSAVVAGLMVEGGRAELAAALAAQNFDEAQVAEWLGLSHELGQLSRADRLFVLDGLSGSASDFARFRRRVELAKFASLRAAKIEEVLTTWSHEEPAAALRDVVAWARLRGAEQQAELKTFIDAGIADGSLRSSDVAEALEGRVEAYMPELMAALNERVNHVAQADVITQPGAMNSLIEVIKRGTHVMPIDELVLRAMNMLFQHDLEQVLPFGEVDAQLGPVAPSAWVETRSPLDRLRREMVDFNSLADAQRAYPDISHAIETLKAKLLFEAGDRFEVEAAIARCDVLLKALFDAKSEVSEQREAAARALRDAFASWANSVGERP